MTNALNIIPIILMTIGMILIISGLFNLKTKTIRKLQHLTPPKSLCENKDIILAGAWWFLLGFLLQIIFNRKQGPDTSGPIGLYITFILLIHTMCQPKHKNTRDAPQNPPPATSIESVRSEISYQL